MPELNVLADTAQRNVSEVDTRQTKKQYCANVCLKVNVKLEEMNSFISTRADVTHYEPGKLWYIYNYI
jgi:hypothetical protein